MEMEWTRRGRRAAAASGRTGTGLLGALLVKRRWASGRPGRQGGAQVLPGAPDFANPRRARPVTTSVSIVHRAGGDKTDQWEGQERKTDLADRGPPDDPTSHTIRCTFQQQQQQQQQHLPAVAPAPAPAATAVAVVGVPRAISDTSKTQPNSQTKTKARQDTHNRLDSAAFHAASAESPTRTEGPDPYYAICEDGQRQEQQAGALDGVFRPLDNRLIVTQFQPPEGQTLARAWIAAPAICVARPPGVFATGLAVRSRFDCAATSNMLPLPLLAIFTIPTIWHTFDNSMRPRPPTTRPSIHSSISVLINTESARPPAHPAQQQLEPTSHRVPHPPALCYATSATMGFGYAATTDEQPVRPLRPLPSACSCPGAPHLRLTWVLASKETWTASAAEDTMSIFDMPMAPWLSAQLAHTRRQLESPPPPPPPLAPGTGKLGDTACLPIPMASFDLIAMASSRGSPASHTILSTRRQYRVSLAKASRLEDSQLAGQLLSLHIPMFLAITLSPLAAQNSPLARQSPPGHVGGISGTKPLPHPTCTRSPFPTRVFEHFSNGTRGVGIPQMESYYLSFLCAQHRSIRLPPWTSPKAVLSTHPPRPARTKATTADKETDNGSCQSWGTWACDLDGYEAASPVPPRIVYGDFSLAPPLVPLPFSAMRARGGHALQAQTGFFKGWWRRDAAL
ncbi:hypothetical protein CSOJ01_02812 [Colletotrichum sojae]|uniref:Uncharacterized protein n=1 Tax=Colletotrichum sojae TaxID=2175907 RepID=A0A8H6JPG7_9PEZI|nr:hypothetical protein CSOJ01_02812 [Colletotrichum sojae]